MKRMNKKGFSLVELLISMAIFSLVMIGIIAIMSTTSTNYRKTLFEAKTQEESQVVLNQIEDLLCDAKNSASWSAGDKAISFTNGETGTAAAIQYDDTTNELVYWTGGIGGTRSVLSDCVTNFEVKGVTTQSVGSGADNCATVYLTVDNDGHVYEGVREVYFRNKIEDSDMGDNLAASAVTPPPTGSYDFTVKVNRYQDVNLSSLTNGIADWAGDTEAQKWYTISSVSGYQHITTNAVLNTGSKYSVDTSTTPCVLSSAATGKTCLVTTEAVSFGQKVNGIDGVFTYHNYQTANDEGYMSFIEAKGIDLYGAINSGVSVKYNLQFDVNNNKKDDKNGTQTMRAVQAVVQAEKGFGYNSASNSFDDAIPLEFMAVKDVAGIAVATKNDNLAAKSGTAVVQYLMGSDNRKLNMNLTVGTETYDLVLGMGINGRAFAFQ